MIFSILCDDTRMLNFYRQAIGEPEFVVRNFTNVGHKDITYSITNHNSSLHISPNKGTLKVGQSVAVQFLFKPTEDAVQNQDILFEPEFSQPIRLKMSGGGGYVKCSLSKYRRFDFGHCMIGKETLSYLPITNEGTAILHIKRFVFDDSDTFLKGDNWPLDRVSLFPNTTYNLPIIFSPSEENPPSRKLEIGTLTETWSIELVGQGREAVLIVSKTTMEFSECLIGNSYEQTLELKNVGDVNYPISFKLEQDCPDIEFTPDHIVVAPFSEGKVTISFTPTKPGKSQILLIISSPYSNHRIPITLNSGTAILEFSEDIVNFGLFEKTTKPTAVLKVKNTGTCSTSYSIRDCAKPSSFALVNNLGLLGPGKSVDVLISYTKHTVGNFRETLSCKTDLISKLYYVQVVGQCEEAVVHADELNLVNLGVCPILETASVQFNIRNYGNFPLSFAIKAPYPLKLNPSKGLVPGSKTQQVSLIWTPTGQNELRTQLNISTNIGNFITLVRGKSSFPDIGIKNPTIDFGVCAVGYKYTETATIKNKGVVALNYYIPKPNDVCYEVENSSGTLLPKEERDVEISFTPPSIGRFASSILIECRGMNYKEIIVSGIGATLGLSITPPEFDFGIFYF